MASLTKLPSSMFMFLIITMSICYYKITIVHGWSDAHATFYEDTGGGACGYTSKHGYGVHTTALSTALFNNGLTCGACFEIMCVNDPQWCIPNANSITVTATNFCPPNPGAPHAWCNPPLVHFDLSQPMFTKIAYYRAGIVPVNYRRVSCNRRGGVRFEINGNRNWVLVLVYHVAGDGDVVDMKIKGSNTGWTQMSRNWGQNWQTFVTMEGQNLSFQVTTSDGKTLQFIDVADNSWGFGKSYVGKINF